MKLVKLYNDTNIAGEILLKPLKFSVSKFGRAFTSCNSQKISNEKAFLEVMKKIAYFVIGFFGTIVTSPFALVGLVVKGVANHSVQKKLTPENKKSSLKTETAIHANPPLTVTENSVQKLYEYPGDLSPDAKKEIDTYFLNENTLCISFFEKSPISISIRNQDLFQSEAEIIVNAANKHLGGGGGIDGAIHNKGGKRYAQAHHHLQRKYNSSYTCGYAEMIDSGDLKKYNNINHVIVVAGPCGKSSPKKESELYSCYYNSLVLALQHKSIAFPAISTGIFGFPKDRAAAISLRAIGDFIANYPHTSLKAISIHFLTSKELQDYENAAKIGVI
jgi:O-acetyl-ADP-ribose deacetylase